ncbi:MAG: homocysteine S-methyltransferase family protein [Atopobiaceae bacterium]|jgi:methionine synthase I (cobalamin-dependent)|nr:homocysteine S-methyltransferase family protein [Atopobiaceae bacterium]MCI2173548.1 homocysteine S-methyltransferase family protein [Atopobiaceae bacterium]MCI2207810.1 homocysteine S-methyltransferase family protein [Atopobiaceae bacterium]
MVSRPSAVAERWGHPASDDADDQAAFALGRLLVDDGAAPLALDGDIPTLLERLPLSEGVPTPLWALDEPETLSHMHQLMHDAGSDVAIALSGHVTADELDELGVGVSPAGVTRAAVRCALSCGPRLVLGEVDPCGAITHVRAKRAYLEPVRALMDGGVHGFLLGHMPSSADAIAAASAIPMGVRPVIACLETDPSLRIPSGEPLDEAFSSLAEAGMDAVGVDGITVADIPLVIDSVVEAAASVGLRLMARVPAGEADASALEGLYDEAAHVLAASGCALMCAGAGAPLGATSSMAASALEV